MKLIHLYIGKVPLNLLFLIIYMSQNTQNRKEKKPRFCFACLEKGSFITRFR